MPKLSLNKFDAVALFFKVIALFCGLPNGDTIFL